MAPKDAAEAEGLTPIQTVGARLSRALSNINSVGRSQDVTTLSEEQVEKIATSLVAAVEAAVKALKAGPRKPGEKRKKFVEL